MRKKIVAGNWKMFKTQSETRLFFKEWEALFASSLVKENAKIDGPEVVFFPPAMLLSTAIESGGDLGLQFGPQNIATDKEGAFTGENSAWSANEMGATYALIGHSERRTLFFETDEAISKKVAYANEIGLTPMLCVGESLEQREANQTESVIADQLKLGLSKVLQAKNIVIAYEPVWAIGTGKVATPEQAENVHLFIRKELSRLYGESTAQTISILYGGSVKPDNAKSLAKGPNIDGFLVGGASLKASDFHAISMSV